MSSDTTPDAAPASATPAVHRSAWRWLAVPLVLAVLLLAGLGSGLWWTLTQASGTAWLAERLPGVRITGPRGALLGDFDAERVDIPLPGAGNSVRVLGLGWRGLQVTRGGAGLWMYLSLDELYAARIDLLTTPSADPTVAPTDLRLPMEIEVRRLRVQALYPAGANSTPVRDIQGAVHLGAQGGREHRVDGLSLGYDRLAAMATLRIASSAPLALNAQLALTQASGAAPAALDWSARATLSGPLAAPAAVATLRAQAGPDAPAQSLDARATLRPFAAWPLGELQASAQALDLHALHSAAPSTSLSGTAVARSSGLDQPAAVDIDLANALPGRWNEGLLPLRQLAVQLQGRPDQPGTLALQRLDAELGTAQASAGRVQGQGRWTAQHWTLDAQLTQLLPAGLDARAPAMRLSGPVTLSGTGFDGGSLDAAMLEMKADLAGQLARSGPARAVQLRLDAQLTPQRIVLREARASAGGARATLVGEATRTSAGTAGSAAIWQLKGQTTLVDFDPLPWWPGRDDSPWRQGPHRLNAQGEFDVAVPLPGPGTSPALAAWLSTLRGTASLKLTNSVLAGVPLSGSAALRSSDGVQAVPTLQLDAAGNSLSIEGRLATRGDGSDDRWDLRLAAPALARLAPLWRLAGTSAGTPVNLSGSAGATAHVDGRWPAVRTQGQAEASALVAGTASVQRAQAQWQMGTRADAPVDAQLTLTQAAAGGASLDSARLQLSGSARAHRIELRVDSQARPPAWTDTVQGVAAPSAPASQAAAGVAVAGTVARMTAQGGLVESAGNAFAGWRGSVQLLEVGPAAPQAPPWLATRDLALEALWAGGPPRATLQPGRAELLGGALRWSRIAWQGAGAAGEPAQLEAKAELEPLLVAPILRRLQPAFGWGGDLAVAGHIDVRSAPSFSADIVLERSRGDLSVTDETGTQALGLSDLRLGLNAADGVWSFTQGLAGSTLGVGAGAVVARTSPQATWPAADTPISGVLELQVANLGTWGTWVPAGWRLGGKLRTSATIGGRFGAPEYTGELRGEALSARNFLQGVNVTDGDVAIALQGASARIEHFSARAGGGTVSLEGDASLGEAPKAQLKLVAERFQVLGRVDRRLVTSGSAQLRLERQALALDGDFRIDEGLFDFSKSDAPSLSSDVVVLRGPRRAEDADANKAPGANGNPGAQRNVAVNLKIDLGDKLRVRGSGLDTGLRGGLRLTTPGGLLTLNGTVATRDGTYAAYGQKLTIDRGEFVFNGPADNPRLDIEATRPNLDIRVGVLVGGTAQNPRIRLFSDSDLSEVDKLSWLVLGRASDGLGRTDTALLQRAALALLAGEGEGPTDQLIKAIGLDEVSLRQTEGEVRETVISLGKQLSRRWFVGYERSLNATTGSWQLVYRVAQRFTLRAQSGAESSLDAIWTWRWQ